jgi:hypothetical protein
MVGEAEPVGLGLYVAIVLGIALASAVWWTYFGVVALVTERRLVRATAGRQRNLLARDSYSYLHYDGGWGRAGRLRSGGDDRSSR